jgi:hypothetical protein
MIEDTLSREVVESRLAWLKLKANEPERLAIDHSNLGEHSERFAWICKDLEVDWGVTGVHYLNRLINRLPWRSRWEDHFIRRTDLYHRDERLRPGRERMSHQSEIYHRRRIQIFVQGFLKLCLLH